MEWAGRRRLRRRHPVTAVNTMRRTWLLIIFVAINLWNSSVTVSTEIQVMGHYLVWKMKNQQILTTEIWKYVTLWSWEETDNVSWRFIYHSAFGDKQQMDMNNACSTWNCRWNFTKYSRDISRNLLYPHLRDPCLICHRRRPCYHLYDISEHSKWLDEIFAGFLIVNKTCL